MFVFEEAPQLLTNCAPNKPRVIDIQVLRDLKSADVRPGLFTLEAQINLQGWTAKRDTIMDDIVWSTGGMRPYCFPMTAGNNYQTILLPTT